MNHAESKLQQQCVAWFRAQYPQYAMLLVHPINEGSGHTAVDRRRQGIHKAEGTVPGVPDLILFLPAYPGLSYVISKWTEVHGLGIELKTSKGRQSQQQKDFQRMFEAAGYAYVVIRSFDEFRVYVTSYILASFEGVRDNIAEAHKELTAEQEAREKEHFMKVIGKK